MKLTIGHLYPDLLNLYGDRGNIQCFRKRLEWRGIEAEVIPFLSGDEIDFSKLDIVLLGGGSDREQELVCSHLQKIRENFKTYVEDNGVVLAVCGGYQLLGNYYKTQTKTIQGLGILNIKTEWEPERLILHPGAHVGAGVDAGTAQIIKGLNEVLTADTDCVIALETMAGKGSEIGRTFEELARIYDGVVHNEKLRVCFDTCHTNDSGYDIVHHFDDVIDEFDRILGKDQIAVFHINDSKNPRGAAKDRHANIGFGEIGFDALHHIVTHKDFEAIPKILETPYIPDPQNKKKSYAPYKYEIEMLRNGSFCPDLPEQIVTLSLDK